ncbi:MAG: ribokinase [Notoacmeibacter sp.]
MLKNGVCVLGIFAADTAYYARRLPNIAETILGSNFKLGAGGKGSNQAIAAAKAGAKVVFISKIGKDAFGDLALKTLESAGVTTRLDVMNDQPTGAAFIFINEVSGENAIIVFAGAAGTLNAADVEKHRNQIEASSVFVTQLEQPLDAAIRGLEIASASGTITIFNPSPFAEFPESIFPLCDYIVPNEVEAAAMVGFEIKFIDDAKLASDIILKKGAKAVLMTLGSRGSLFHTSAQSIHIPARAFGAVIDTTGAGDAFLGGFASALSQGFEPLAAARFGSVTAGIAVTRSGTATAMPTFVEINQRLAEGS